MTDPSALISQCLAVVTNLLTASETVGIKVAELRFEGQGVDILTPGIIVMLSPPSSLGNARALPAAQLWELTLFIAPAPGQTLTGEIIAAMRIAQQAHLIVRRTLRESMLSQNEPFAIVKSVPNNVIFAVNYDIPFALFP